MPDHLQSTSGCWTSSAFLGGEQDLGGGVPRAMIGEMPADLLCERGVIVAGDPDSCINSVKRHQEFGVDQTLLIMQSDQIPHEKAERSIELFGKEVIPAFK